MAPNINTVCKKSTLVVANHRESHANICNIEVNIATMQKQNCCITAEPQNHCNTLPLCTQQNVHELATSQDNLYTIENPQTTNLSASTMEASSSPVMNPTRESPIDSDQLTLNPLSSVHHLFKLGTAENLRCRTGSSRSRHAGRWWRGCK